MSPIKIYEYLAAGKTVVASQSPDLDFLEREGLGRIVPPENATALAEGLIEVLSDPRWGARARDRGREFVLRHGTQASVAEGVERLCERTRAR